jgi:primosomal protein N' (replication factor Y) (superfamily II helicase)
MIVDVVVPFRVSSSFHYKIDESLQGKLTTGSVVEVSFKSNETHAFVLGVLENTDVPLEKLKSVSQLVVDEPIFDERMLKFLRWISDYYCHPLGEVISVALPKPCWSRKVSKRKTKPKSKTDKLSLLGDADRAALPGHTLNPEQIAAVDTILSPGETRPFLLHGVTGSGKTEVYIRVLQKVVEEGKSGIILVPEIALTPQLLDRFSQRFPGLVAVLHSDLTPKERFEQWERIKKGDAKIVVGARSAIFAPVPELGVVIVDEEHEASFKQEDSVRYHARDLAIVRASMYGAKVVLGTATPSFESYSNALTGRYVYCRLTKRIQDRPLPLMRFVDLRDTSQVYSQELPWLSRLLCSRIEETLRQKQQVLLFLNRLGFAHFLYCEDCGHTWRCKSCDVALTYYRHPPALKCHYCGAFRKPPSQCDECQGTHLKSIGLGTEQVENELRRIFPDARIGRMDRSCIKNRHDLETILENISKREIDIIIGTQMITKGHDFPGIALVGILVADASLNIPDFRAQERTFQVITQVSGRAGRADTPGEVIIQTINPEHPVLRYAASNSVEDFYRWEMLTRKNFGFPPYQRLAMLRFQHKDPQRVEQFAREISQFLRNDIAKSKMRCQVVGPAEAPLAKLKNLYRWHCLVKSESVKELQAMLKRSQEYAVFRKSAVQFSVDVDPMTAM